MGGDRAPDAVIDGALDAVRRLDLSIALVGPAAALSTALRRSDLSGLSETIRVVDAPEYIEMHEAPLAALRRKRRSSIRIAADLVAAGGADSLFTAGHSGAALLAAHAALGLLPGVERPALAVTVPTLTGAAILLDVGANIECRPEHLLQFGLVGSAYARVTMLVDQPRVGLLSIGEEAGKGNDLIREAHGLLRDAPLHFVGNVEARDLFTGRADVVVCDGFTGNIALKVGEGLIDAVGTMLRDEFDGALVSQIGALLTRRAFARFRQRVNYEEHGAAVLLGVGGLVLVGHGRSSPRAISNGIAMAARLAEAQLMQRLLEQRTDLKAP
jgi:glycerol-3-phosphate acyltransferase PlsX